MPAFEPPGAIDVWNILLDPSPKDAARRPPVASAAEEWERLSRCVQPKNGGDGSSLWLGALLSFLAMRTRRCGSRSASFLSTSARPLRRRPSVFSGSVSLTPVAGCSWQSRAIAGAESTLRGCARSFVSTTLHTGSSPPARGRTAAVPAVRGSGGGLVPRVGPQRGACEGGRGGVPACLRRFGVSVAPDESPAILDTELEPGGASAFSLYDIDVPDGYVGALEVEGTGHRVWHFGEKGNEIRGRGATERETRQSM